jgi:hypothetical protein
MESASRERKRQREALQAAVACRIEPEAWHECGVSTKAKVKASNDCLVPSQMYLLVRTSMSTPKTSAAGPAARSNGK